MRITLTPNIDQVKAFDNSLAKERVNSTRVITMLAGVLFLIYTVIDYFGISADSFSILLYARVANSCVLAVAFYLTFQACFLKHYNKILLLGYYSSGITICLGVYLSKSTEYSYDSYFAALMILIITCYSWSYLPIKKTTVMSLVFVGVYSYIKLIAHQVNLGIELLTVVAHFFFLMSVILIGAIAQYIRDSIIYKNLKLQDDLKVIIEAKTREAQKQKTLANLDPLTGISNRRYVTNHVRESIEGLDQLTTELVVIFIDLNGFKAINDNFGHDSGDKVLQVVAKKLKQIARENDCVARLGGDEFLLGVGVKKPSDQFVKEMVEEIKSKIEAPIAFNGNFLNVGVSIGCAHYPKDGKGVRELIKAADANMYTDKRITRENQPFEVVRSPEYS